jgi:Flp pilus assembly protein TadG
MARFMGRLVVHLFRRFGNSTRGTAAIEFALVIPVLAAVAITLPDVASIAANDINMESGVRAAVQYAMNGGSSTATAQTLGISAWTSKPTGGTLTATEACICGSGAGTCGQICQDGSLPQTYMTVTASATIAGYVITMPLTTTQVVRIQ